MLFRPASPEVMTTVASPQEYPRYGRDLIKIIDSKVPLAAAFPLISRITAVFPKPILLIRRRSRLEAFELWAQVGEIMLANSTHGW